MKKQFSPRRIFAPAFLGILCAVGVFSVLFTDAGHRLQGAIIESNTTEFSEAHLIAEEKKLSLKINVSASNVTKIEGTLLYDDESVVLSNPISQVWELLLVDEGVRKKFTLLFSKPTTIYKWSTLITWSLTPVLPESHAINLVNMNIYMTDDGVLKLTSEGTGEF